MDMVASPLSLKYACNERGYSGCTAVAKYERRCSASSSDFTGARAPEDPRPLRVTHFWRRDAPESYAHTFGYAPATSSPFCSPKWGQFSTNVFKRQGASHHIVENIYFVALAGLKQMTHIKIPVLFKTEQKFSFVATVGDMITGSVYPSSFPAWHFYM